MIARLVGSAPSAAALAWPAAAHHEPATTTLSFALGGAAFALTALTIAESRHNERARQEESTP